MLFRLLKGDYTTKIEEIEKKKPDHDKYITTPEFNELAKFSKKKSYYWFSKKDRFWWKTEKNYY